MRALAMVAAAIARQIESGGGGMPANLLGGGERDLVARYVTEQAGDR